MIPTDGRGGFTQPALQVRIANVIARNEGSTLFGNIKMKWSITVQNDTPKTQEVRAYVFDRFGGLIDKAPDFSWKNIGAGQSAVIEISENVDLELIKGQYQITLQTQDNSFSDRVVYDGVAGKLLQQVNTSESEKIIQQETQKSSSPLKDVPTPTNKLAEVIGAGTAGAYTGLIIGIAIVAVIAYFILTQRGK